MDPVGVLAIMPSPPTLVSWPSSVKIFSLGDDSVVEGDVVIHGLAAPEDGHVQHHPGLHVEAPVRQIPQAVQLVHLQLRHESEASQIHSQHRDAVQRHRPGQMQNGAVAAEGDEQIRRADLLM